MIFTLAGQASPHLFFPLGKNPWLKDQLASSTKPLVDVLSHRLLNETFPLLGICPTLDHFCFFPPPQATSTRAIVLKDEAFRSWGDLPKPSSAKCAELLGKARVEKLLCEVMQIDR